MVPVPIAARNSHSSRLLYVLFSVASQHVPRILHRAGDSDVSFALVKRDGFDRHDPKSIVFVVLIPVLVLLSGLFAGLTLGYMSLDETQLNVLSISGTPDQRKYANKIKPIRKNGHLLLVTLLLANMIVNESLPVIADPVLGGGVQSVVVSTVLIVIFSEIIPQSLFTRHGLYLGAKMAGFTKCLIYGMGIIAWPVAKLLEFVLGAHHGIIYRRAELKELIAMHSSHATHGGDLKTDTVTIIGATLDLQEKVVKQAMTPISDVFMLSIDSKLDYALLKKICQTGHSRVPVYEEVDVPISVVAESKDTVNSVEKQKPRTQKVKKIIGILLVKQCVLLDPKDATPLRKIPLNKVPFVPNNEPLLGILDKFQEGRSHMAIVSRFSVEKAASVKKAVKRGLTQRLRERVGMGDTDSDTESETEEDKKNISSGRKKRSGRNKLMNALKSHNDVEDGTEDGDTIGKGEESTGLALYETQYDVQPVSPNLKEDANGNAEKSNGNVNAFKGEGKKSMISSFQLPKMAAGMTSMSVLEQSMPADAVLAKEGAAEFLQGFDPAVMPLGIITLEDVLEELIGEEIYDEFDTQGAHGDPYEVPPIVAQVIETKAETTGTAGHSRPASILRPESSHGAKIASALTAQVPSALKGLGFFRPRSAPPIPRDDPNTGEKTVRIDESNNQEIRHGAAIYNGTATPPIQMPRPVRGTGRHPPSVILEQHSSVSSSESGMGPALMPAPTEVPTNPAFGGANKGDAQPPAYPGSVQPYPTVVSAIPAIPAAVKAPSRDASPGPALEAILFDRKRRLAAATLGGISVNTSATVQATPSVTQGGSQTVVASPTTPGSLTGGVSKDAAAATPSISPAPSLGAVAGGGSSGPSGGAGVLPARMVHAVSNKGTRFKSSPLGGMDRTGVVVADYVKAKDGVAEQNPESKED